MSDLDNPGQSMCSIKPMQSPPCNDFCDCLCSQVGAVVVGFDRNVNYYKIQYATLCIRENPGCLFIATNRDAVTHLTDAQEWAGRQACVMGSWSVHGNVLKGREKMNSIGVDTL